MPFLSPPQGGNWRNEMKLNGKDLDALLQSPSHRMAELTMQGAVVDLLSQLDNIGVGNQNFIDEGDGKPAVHMTMLTLTTSMSILINMFARMNPEDHPYLFEKLEAFLKDAPREAQKLRHEMMNEATGNA